jgi:hypothetical protein
MRAYVDLQLWLHLRNGGWLVVCSSHVLGETRVGDVRICYLHAHVSCVVQDLPVMSKHAVQRYTVGIQERHQLVLAPLLIGPLLVRTWHQP